MSFVKLKVGGVIFETTRETLTKFPESKLAKMTMFPAEMYTDERLNMESQARLDINPVYFRAVLDWLR